MVHSYTRLQDSCHFSITGFHPFCGGALLSSRTVLSAAHCAVVGVAKFVVVLGDRDTRDSGEQGEQAHAGHRSSH